MNRRHFLQGTGAALAAAALTPLASAQNAPAKKRQFRKAVNLGMAKAPGVSVMDRFKMIKDAGFDGVELNRPDTIPLDEILKARDATGPLSWSTTSRPTKPTTSPPGYSEAQARVSFIATASSKSRAATRRA